MVLSGEGGEQVKEQEGVIAAKDYEIDLLKRYSAKSNTRNRIPGTNCTESAVSCPGFRGVLASYAMPSTDVLYGAVPAPRDARY
eukprot:650805-Rhodomonas_salina.1